MSTRLRGSRTKSLLTAGIRRYFEDGSRAVDSPLWWADVADGGATFANLWAAAREMVLAEWVQQHPGTRPAAWWWYERDQQPPGTAAEQLAYLEHHELVTDAERRRLTRANFEPVRITDDDVREDS